MLRSLCLLFVILPGYTKILPDRNVQLTFTMNHTIRAIEGAENLAVLINQHPHAEVLNAVLISEFMKDGRIKILGSPEVTSLLEKEGIAMHSNPDGAVLRHLGRLIGRSVVLAQITILNIRFDSETRGVFPIQSRYKTAYIKASVAVSNLDEGQYLDTWLIDVSHKEALENPGDEATFDGMVLERLLKKAFLEFATLFLTMDETVSIPLFTNKKLGLRDMASAVKNEDYDTAFNLGEKAVALAEEKSGLKPRYKARAYFNLGALCLREGNFDRALQCFKKARTLEDIPSIDDVLDKAKTAAGQERTRAHKMASDTDDLLNRLRYVKSLFNEGLIDDDEYADKRKNVLATNHFQKDMNMKERLEKAQAYHEEQLISDKEYKLMKRQILEESGD